MQVFPGIGHRLLLGFLTQPGHKGFVGLFFLLLRTQRQRRIPVRLRQGEQGGQQREGLRCRGSDSA